MSPTVPLRELLAAADAVLLDFDGPVCSVFAGFSAARIAAELRGVVRAHGIEVADHIRRETDPMEVLRWAATLGLTELTHEVETSLCRAELRAVETAAPTRDADETVIAARAAGKAVAIVSNNSADAIETYLSARGLMAHVAFIAGRAFAEPDRMKPSPEPIWRATAALGVGAKSSVLVGDSLFDIEAAIAAGASVIAYANKAPKVERFARAGADVVVTSMSEVARAMLALGESR